MTVGVQDNQTSLKVSASLLQRSQIPIQYTLADRFDFGRIGWWRWLFRWVRLNFTMQYQQQNQWCWSAVAVSTSRYYDTSSTWTQCGLVNAELGQTTCCANGGSSQCNQPWYLDRALNRTGNLTSWVGGSVGLDTVRAQINSNRLLGVRIGWSGGGGHFVIIEGYRMNLNTIAIEDPWYGPSEMDYDTFRTSYQTTGSWTHTYYTEP